MALTPFQKMNVWLEYQHIPNALRWFEVAGQTVFPVYGQTGGLCAQYVAYLIARCPTDAYDMGLEGMVDDERGKWIPLRFGQDETEESVARKVKQSVEALLGNDTA